MPTIQVLDKHVAELIAAGEVVERPASVIKELLENTIDAGARHVTVEIRDGGVTYMRVTDDGCGIHREDVPTAFLRHATSKVRTAQDLDAIGTLGFRGEALASVAAVAKVELTTCAAGEIVGTRYVIHGGEEVLLEDAGCPEGCTFVVEDLFYNIPARMKFLKKDVSEGNAVAGVVERLALSHPEIAFRFIRNGRTELQTTGNGQLLDCIHAVFGKPFAASLVSVDYSMNGVKVQGYICKPESGRPNRTMQHFFVNSRYVKTQTAMIALERAYKGVMMGGRFPACVLGIELPAVTVDANVHPAKIEVRFINEKPVFDAVYYGVRSALESRSDFRRVLQQEEKPTVQPRIVPPPAVAKPASPPAPPTPVVNLPRPTAYQKPSERRQAASYLNMMADDDRPREAVMRDAAAPVFPLHKDTVVEETAVPVTVPAPAPAESRPTEQSVELTVMEEQAEVRLVGEVFATYILAQMGENLFLIDKHAAHERILYNQLKEQARVDTQPLLTPVSVTVSREEHSVLLDAREELEQAGILLEDFGGRSVLVRSFPLILAGTDIDATVQEIAAGLVGGNREVRSSKLDWIYHSSACRAAIKAGNISGERELMELAKRVLLHEDIRHCPHGRPVCVEMARKDLEKLFGRIV